MRQTVSALGCCDCLLESILILIPLGHEGQPARDQPPLKSLLSKLWPVGYKVQQSSRLSECSMQGSPR